MGILQQRLGEPVAAESAYREAIRVKPDYADAWTNLGNLLFERDDPHGALRAFQQAMRSAPASPEPAYNLGVALEHFGLWDGALAAFQAAVEVDPGHVDAHWSAALALLRAGRFEQGIHEFEGVSSAASRGRARALSRHGTVALWQAARSWCGPNKVSETHCNSCASRPR